MHNVIPIIIFLVLIIAKVVKAAQEQRSAGSGGDEGWWEDEPGNSQPTPAKPSPTVRAPQPSIATSAPKAPVPRPEPSSHVREILRQLQQQAQPLAAARPAPAPQPEPARRYLDEEKVEKELASAAQEASARATGDIYQQSLTKAFPKVKVRALSIASAKQRPPIRVRAQGKANLRRAILISEILGPPRAFDV